MQEPAMLTAIKQQNASTLPFDNHLLDRLMDEARIDVALTTSKHNVQYLLGGHRTFFFDHMEAMGPSRYLPVLAYPKGAPEQAAYGGHGTENFQLALSPLWTPQVYTGPAGSAESMQKTVDHLPKLGLKPRRIGVEWPFASHERRHIGCRRADRSSQSVERWKRLARLAEAVLGGAPIIGALLRAH